MFLHFIRNPSFIDKRIDVAYKEKEFQFPILTKIHNRPLIFILNSQFTTGMLNRFKPQPSTKGMRFVTPNWEESALSLTPATRFYLGRGILQLGKFAGLIKYWTLDVGSLILAPTKE